MARLVVVGSIATDEVVRLAEPLRAGTHVESRGRTERIGGGAANVALALAAAGHSVAVVSAVGDDARGGRLLAELERAGVDCRAVARVAGESTRSIVLLEPSGERTVVNVHRSAEGGPPDRLRGLDADLVYVRSRATDLSPLLASLRARVVAHVPPVGPLSRPAPVLVASETDLAAGDRGAPWALARRVAGPRVEWMVITRGRAGAIAVSEGRAVEAPGRVAPVVDTTGAGDAFAAGLLHAMAGGAEVPEALVTGTRWGAAAVGCDGSALPAATVRALLAPEPGAR